MVIEIFSISFKLAWLLLIHGLSIMDFPFWYSLGGVDRDERILNPSAVDFGGAPSWNPIPWAVA